MSRSSASTVRTGSMAVRTATWERCRAIDDYIPGHTLECYEVRGVGDAAERGPGRRDVHAWHVGNDLFRLFDS
jgi:hypothetical protein